VKTFNDYTRVVFVWLLQAPHAANGHPPLRRSTRIQAEKVKKEAADAAPGDAGGVQEEGVSRRPKRHAPKAKDGEEKTPKRKAKSPRATSKAPRGAGKASTDRGKSPSRRKASSSRSRAKSPSSKTTPVHKGKSPAKGKGTKGKGTKPPLKRRAGK